MIRRLLKQQEIKSGDISVIKKHIYGDFSTHWHEFFEMEYIISGSGKYIIDGREYEIKKGMLFFMSPINFHELKSADAEIINLKFSDGICSRSVLYPLTDRAVENAIEFFEKAKEKNVVFVPGNPFYIDARNANTMRLNFTNSDEETIVEGIKRLGELIK